MGTIGTLFRFRINYTIKSKSIIDKNAEKSYIIQMYLFVYSGPSLVFITMFYFRRSLR